MSQNIDNEREVKKIFSKYQKCVHFQNLVKDGYSYFLETDDVGSLENLKQIKNRVDLTLSMLRPLSKLFLKNCYLKRIDSHWWMNVYSKSTFYRYKNEAIQEFLYYFNL